MNKKITRKIISVSRRTDIPAFYSEWYINRVRAGYCTVVNPFNANQVSYVSLKPADVIAFVFWTRNPAPLIKHIPELDKKGYLYYFQYTLIGYPKEIDPKSPLLSSAIQIFQKLSKQIGKEKVIWRYDPILFSDITDYEWHQKHFLNILKELKGYTQRLVISFLDPYRRTQLRMSNKENVGFKLSNDVFEAEAYKKLSKFIAKNANSEGIEVQSCAEEIDLQEIGIKHGKCIDDDLIASIAHCPLALKKDPAQRKPCGCVISKDIGANDTCLFGCKYCYATRSLTLAEKNLKLHDKNSPSLIGWHECEVKPKSEAQINLFDDPNI